MNTNTNASGSNVSANQSPRVKKLRIKAKKLAGIISVTVSLSVPIVIQTGNSSEKATSQPTGVTIIASDNNTKHETPEGVEITLSSRSKVEYRTSISGTTMYMTVSGEVLLNLRKRLTNQIETLIVQVETNKTEIKVTPGNKIFIRAWPGDENIMIEVLQGNGAQVNTSTLSANLQPQRMAQVYGNNIKIKDAGQKMQRFDGLAKDLYTLMNVAKEWYNIEVEFRDNVENRRFSIGINKDIDLKHILRILELNKIKSTRNGKKIILEAMK